MSLNYLLRKYPKSTATVAQLWAYADSWMQHSSGCVKRNGLRCKTMALIYLDQNEELSHDA